MKTCLKCKTIYSPLDSSIVIDWHTHQSFLHFVVTISNHRLPPSSVGAGDEHQLGISLVDTEIIEAENISHISDEANSGIIHIQ